MTALYTIKSVTYAEDIKVCADIWLTSSLAAHNFIEPQFWQDNYVMMREHYLPASQLQLLLDREMPIAFSAVYGETLAALFVIPSYWGEKAGKTLLNHLQQRHDKLELTVYKQNQRAVSFYQKMDFKIIAEQRCSHTKAEELLMRWQHPNYI